MLKLDAINNVLRRVGLGPVTSLDTNGISAAAHAERFIDETSRSTQTQGWSFNTRTNVLLSRDSNGKIAVPANALFIDTDGTSKMFPVDTVDGYLYDQQNNTNVWEQDLYVLYFVYKDFADLPEAFANFVITEAAYKFNRAHRKDQALDKMLQEEMQTRWVRVKQMDNDLGDVNVLDTTDMSLMRARPRMRTRSFY